MNYEERIRAAKPKMSKSFSRLADYLLDSYIEASFMTASELAHTLNLDAATVVRFSQFLGYHGFPELQQEIRQKVRNDLLLRPREALEPNSVAGIAQSAMQEIAEAIEHTKISLNTEALSRLVELLGHVRRTVIFAEGPAQPNAYSLVQYLEQGGFPVYIARAGVVDLARALNNATHHDLILAVEITGQTPYIASALCEARSRGIPTAAIVGAASLTSTQCADIVIAAASHPSVGVGIVSLEAIIYTLAKLLRRRYADRFAGTEQAILEISNRIQQPVK
ncbi:MAG: MurR/RpiR family transcriptional regulator [Anaerolineales bacterium]|nr:MurR/RpiR family transcriptional regulator [Anaerolineales bacterium]MDW8162353.1 MurR/RpiR family transcriptional regulator [Anaerolineales bacterium]